MDGESPKKERNPKTWDGDITKSKNVCIFYAMTIGHSLAYNKHEMNVAGTMLCTQPWFIKE